MSSFDSGVVPINKPVGLSSHDVVNRVRRITGERRVGHAGTLDPLAEGLLIVLIGKKATQRQDEFMTLSPKIYEAEITFGSTSATEDRQGPFTTVATLDQLAKIQRADIEAVLPGFLGTINQVPPAFSAIKIQGKTAYRRAREGSLDVRLLAPRQVDIFHIDILSFVPATPQFPPTVRVRVNCGKGVYIRSLARDIGNALGVGAYLSALKRSGIGHIMLSEAYSIEDFEKAWGNEANVSKIKTAPL